MFIRYLVQHYNAENKLISCFAETNKNKADECFKSLCCCNRDFIGDIIELLEVDYESQELIVIRTVIC